MMNKENINYEYKKLCPFKWFVLENFPFIEADFDALTNWQLFCKLGQEMNKIINSVNSSGEQVEALTKAFNNLQDYVNNYFDNLDVQEEINNKLNEMAESGELEEIISQYLNTNAILFFKTVDDMKKATNLRNGSVCKTLGFYSENDGGSGTYKITNNSLLNIDNMFVHQVSNNLKAELIIENNTINILSIGARRQNKNIKYDIKNYLLRYIEYLDNFDYVIKLYIPAGLYTTSSCELLRPKGFYIYGDDGMFNGYPTKTVITAIEDEQEYILKVGSYTRVSTSFVLTNITISSGIYTYSDEVKNYVCNSMYKILQSALIFKNNSFGKLDSLNFEYINGTALSIDTAWEMCFGKLNFENINAHDSACMIFNKTSTEIANANISDSLFDYLRFEKFTGNCISFENGNLGIGLKFNNINVEPSRLEASNIIYNNVTSSVNLERYFAIFDIKGTCNFTVGDIQENNVLYRYYTINGKNYSFGNIINYSNNNQVLSCIINSVTIANSNINTQLINNDGFYSHLRTKVLINKVNNRTNYSCILKVDKFGEIVINSTLNKFSEFSNVEGTFKACQKFYKRDSTQEQGLLCYNKDSSNNKHLCIKTNNLMKSTGKAFMEYIIADTKLQIRALIPNGQTLKVRVQSLDFTTIALADLVGTGDFKIYEIPYTNTNFLGKIVDFGTVNNNDEIIGIFDVFQG